MYIVHNHIFSERRYHNIFSLWFLVLVFLHKDYVTENVTANTYNISLEYVLSLRNRQPCIFHGCRDKCQWSIFSNIHWLLFWQTGLNVVWYMQAHIIIHFKSNQDKIMHKSCSLHLQPKKMIDESCYREQNQ